MHRYTLLTPLSLILSLWIIAAPSDSCADPPDSGDWIQLFNGKNLDGWTPKIRYHELGNNHANTFRVKDGLLKVGYEAYDSFDNTFGHLFYQGSFSHYRIRCEYRFVGTQCKGGPGWALRNSGIMIHGEDPTSMDKDQEFPVSIEVQLLGRRRPTQADHRQPVYTPEQTVVKDGKLFKPHCTNSSSETYHGEQWVTVEVEVRGNESIKHIIDGKVVLEYTEPQLDERDKHARSLAAKAGTIQLSAGTISLQSESHPVEFRKVELMVLKH